MNKTNLQHSNLFSSSPLLHLVIIQTHIFNHYIYSIQIPLFQRWKQRRDSERYCLPSRPQFPNIHFSKHYYIISLLTSAIYYNEDQLALAIAVAAGMFDVIKERLHSPSTFFDQLVFSNYVSMKLGSGKQV